jgi:hypothetical protein
MDIIIWTLGLCAIMFFLALNSFALGRNTKSIKIEIVDNNNTRQTTEGVFDEIMIDCRTLIIQNK